MVVSSWASAMSLQIPDTYCLEQNNTTHSCKGNNTCWEGYDELSLVYILSVPMTIALAVSQFFQWYGVVFSIKLWITWFVICSFQINLLFLVNIVRILVTKLNDDHSNHEGTHVRKALRATLILFPLLGITNLLFFVGEKWLLGSRIWFFYNKLRLFGRKRGCN